LIFITTISFCEIGEMLQKWVQFENTLVGRISNG
jgi:hypothetical protein